MRQKALRMRKRMIILLVIAAVVLTALFSMGFTLASADTYVADYSKFEEFTQNDDVEGVASFTVGDYIARVKSYGYSNDVALQSQHLYGIIPEELFHNEGSWFYKGYDYSFYVETGESMVATSRYVSEVVLLDHQYEFEENTSVITTRVVLFSQAYNTIQLNGGGWRTDLAGQTTRDYYLKNVKFIVSVQNEHEKNYGDEGYTKAGDSGSVLTSASVTYSGMYKKGLNLSFSNIIQSGINFGIGSIPIFGDIYNQYLQTISVFSTAASMFQPGQVNIDNNASKEFYEYDDKINQAGNQNPYYIKTAEVSPNATQDLYIDDYAEASVRIANTGTEAFVSCMIGYNLYVDDSYSDFMINESGEKVDVDFTYETDTIKHYYTDLLYENADEAESGDNEGYLLREDSIQEFEYSPDKNAKYTVTAGADKLVQVVAPDGAATAWQPSITYKFVTNNYYQINVKTGTSFTAGSYTLSIAFSPDNAVLGSNSVIFSNTDREYLTLTLPQNNYYRFVCSEPGVTMYIRDSLFEEAYASGQDVRINKNSSETFYVEIYSEQKLTKTIAIQCYKEKDLVFYTNTVEGIFTQPIRAGTSYTLPELSTTPVNMTFGGWWTTENFADGTQIDDDTISEIWEEESSSVELYAKWDPIPVDPEMYTLYLNNDGVVTEVPVTYGEYLNGVTTPIKRGHTFNGWYDGETLVINSDGVLVDENGNSCVWSYETDLYLFANFTVNTYTITYPTNRSIQVQYGTTVILPTDIRIGYEGYWKFEGVEIPMGSAIVYMYDHDISLTPIWVEATYILTLIHNDGGSGKTIIEFNYGDNPTITAPANSGYMATGATKNANGTGTNYFTGNKVKENGYYVIKLIATEQFNFSEDTTLYIIWEPLVLVYSIPHYNLEAPSNANLIGNQSVTIVHDQKINIVAGYHDGYTFSHFIINDAVKTKNSIKQRFYLKMDAVTGNNVISYYPYTHEGFIHIYYSPATRALAEEENIMTGKEQTENNLLPFWNVYNETANIISEELTDEGRIVDPYVLGQPVTDGIVLSDRKIRLQ